MQMDAEEDGKPFYRPAGVVAAPPARDDDSLSATDETEHEAALGDDENAPLVAGEEE
jgi:hypothetical protein